MRLALVVVVMSSAAFAHGTSLPGLQPSQLTLGAIEETLPPLPPPPSLNLTSVHLRLIDQQIQLLGFQKRPIGGGVVLTVFGSAAVLSGLIMIPISYLFVFGLIFTGAALLPFAAGLVWLLTDLSFNRRIDEAITRLQEERAQFGAPATATAPRVGAAMVELASF